MTYQFPLAGRLPYEAQSLTELAFKQQREVPPALNEVNPEVSAPLAVAVQHPMALDPRDRYPSAEAMRAALVDGVRGIEPATPATRAAEPATAATTVHAGTGATAATRAVEPRRAREHDAPGVRRPPPRRRRRWPPPPAPERRGRRERPAPARTRLSARRAGAGARGAPSGCCCCSSCSPRARPPRSSRHRRPRCVPPRRRLRRREPQRRRAQAAHRREHAERPRAGQGASPARSAAAVAASVPSPIASRSRHGALDEGQVVHGDEPHHGDSRAQAQVAQVAAGQAQGAGRARAALHQQLVGLPPARLGEVDAPAARRIRRGAIPWRPSRVGMAQSNVSIPGSTPRRSSISPIPSRCGPLERDAVQRNGRPAHDLVHLVLVLPQRAADRDALAAAARDGLRGLLAQVAVDALHDPEDELAVGAVGGVPPGSGAASGACAPWSGRCSRA